MIYFVQGGMDMTKNKQELFHLISAKLMEMIRDGHFSGGKLPPEERLAEELEISRMTLRDILGDLEAKGYITRKRGVGTLINVHALEPQIRLDINQFFPEQIQQMGYHPRVMLKSMGYISPPPIVRQHLSVGENETVFLLEKLFFADETPIIYLNTYLSKEGVDEAVSHGEHIPGVGRINFETSRSVLEACISSSFIMDKFELTAAEPFLHVLVDGYNLSGKTVIFSEEFFRSGVMKYSVFQKIIPDKSNVFFYFDKRE